MLVKPTPIKTWNGVCRLHVGNQYFAVRKQLHQNSTSAEVSLLFYVLFIMFDGTSTINVWGWGNFCSASILVNRYRSLMI